MGEPNVVANPDSGNGNLRVAQQAPLAGPGRLVSLSFYVTTPAGDLRLGVYDASGAAGRARSSPRRRSSRPSPFRVRSGGPAAWYSYAFGPLPATYSTTPQTGSAVWSCYATLEGP